MGPLAAALPGQFIVLRLSPAPDGAALLRSYSLSGEPRDERYRVSIKRETHCAAGTYVDTQVQVGDVVDASAPRGSFTLRPGGGPVVLLSAGVGATPVLAMLHALAARASPREVWWIYGARSGGEHPFAAETRILLKALPRGHSHIRYSSPRPGDRPGVDFGVAGRLTRRAIEELGVPREGDFYLCGPSAFMNDLAAGLGAWGVTADRIHTEIFGSSPSTTPGIAAAPRRPPHVPAGLAGGPTGVLRTASMSSGPQRSRTSSNLLRRAICPCGGHAGPGSATLVRPGSSLALSATGQSQSSCRPMAMH